MYAPNNVSMLSTCNDMPKGCKTVPSQSQPYWSVVRIWLHRSDPTLKTNSLETQRRSFQRMMPDLTCLSRSLSFSPKPWYLPSHFFELRLNGLNWLLSKILGHSSELGGLSPNCWQYCRVYKIQKLSETIGLENDRCCCKQVSTHLKVWVVKNSLLNSGIQR